MSRITETTARATTTSTADLIMEDIINLLFQKNLDPNLQFNKFDTKKEIFLDFMAKN